MSNHENLLNSFLHKHVQVSVEKGLVVEGRLVACQFNDKITHTPSVLILENRGLHVLRGDFTVIKVTK